MKMMSWSRYQCLSKSLSRVAEHGRRAAKMLKTGLPSRAPHPRPPAPGDDRRITAKPEAGA